MERDKENILTNKLGIEYIRKSQELEQVKKEFEILLRKEKQVSEKYMQQSQRLQRMERELKKIKSKNKNKNVYIFFVLDTSGSMMGAPITILNFAMKETIVLLREEMRKRVDVNLKIAVLEFNSNCKWLFSEPKNIYRVSWKNLEAVGLTDIGSALVQLNLKMSGNAFFNSEEDVYIPIIVFVSDGAATDDYEKELVRIQQNNKWFQRATKIGIAYGNCADVKMLTEIVGNNQAVVHTCNLDVFRKKIKELSVFAVRESIQDGIFLSE